MTRKAAVGVALGCLLVWACAAQRDVQLYQVGKVSQQIAEAAYKSLRVAKNNGMLVDAQWERVEKAYTGWSIAQKNYADALAMKVLDKQPGKEIALRQALGTLTQLAVHFGGL